MMDTIIEFLSNPSQLIGLSIGVLVVISLIAWQIMNRDKKQFRHSVLPVKQKRGRPKKEEQEGERIKEPEPEYPAMVFTIDGIQFKRISQKIGNTCYLEPSMPHHGLHFMVVELKKRGEYKAYDPRDTPLLSMETPQKAYRAINWGVVNRIFVYRSNLLEHINNFLIGGIALGCFLFLFNLVQKLGG